MDILLEEEDLNRALQSLRLAPPFVQNVTVSFPHGAPRIHARVGIGRIASTVALRVERIDVTPTNGLALRFRRGLGHVLLKRVITHLNRPEIGWDDETGRMVLSVQQLAPWICLTGVSVHGATVRLTARLNVEQITQLTAPQGAAVAARVAGGPATVRDVGEVSSPHEAAVVGSSTE